MLLLCNDKSYKNQKIILKNGRACFINKDKIFNGNSIKKLIGFVNSVEKKYKNTKIPIILCLGKIQFADKLTYIFLEMLCYILIKKYKHLVTVYFNCLHTILIEGIASSPLLLLNKETTENMYRFLEKFDDDIFKNHYRKVLKKKNDAGELSRKMDEIAYFLKYTGVKDESIDQMSEVIVELIGNAWEHASDECLVDVDVTNSYFKLNGIQPYVGINLAVINMSNCLLGDGVRSKILNNKHYLYQRYLHVEKALEIHKRFFDDEYKEMDFFNIASFQHKVSGSGNKIYTGGTGLTKLISSLEEKSDVHKCYVITGERALWFYHDFLKYDKDGWIGFNAENDFFNKRPSLNSVTPNTIYMPGTAYNLNFIMERRLD